MSQVCLKAGVWRLALHKPFFWLVGLDFLAGYASTAYGQTTSTVVNWASCGAGLGEAYQCASVSVPLDYQNSTDERAISIAVTRLLASDHENRKGAVFLNPGGPGGSGTGFVQQAGQALSAMLKGQYDLIGFDPRGVQSSQPYVSCFATQFDAEVFGVASGNFMLNLPTDVSTPSVRANLKRQVDDMTAFTASLAKRCIARSGEFLPFLGTAFVVKDMELLSQLIEGKDERINYWGLSYGTLIGQYMVKILSPERIGRVVLDGIVNPALWNQLPTSFFDQGQQDLDKVFTIFASSCLAAGPNCTLNAEYNFTSTSALVGKIDETLNALYNDAVPVYGLDVPAVGTAANLRAALIRSMYSINLWPGLAALLGQAFKGEFTEMVNTTMPVVSPTSVGQPDYSTYATEVIVCADAKAYSKDHLPPTNAELTDLVLTDLIKYSRRIGERLWYVSLCHLWEHAGLLPERSRYGGTFELKDNTLKTPVLLLSNTYDPVTPLHYAQLANQRLSNNARLIQQTDGVGHTASGQVSLCTAAATQAYFLDGTLPKEKLTQCTVDQLPFVPLPGGGGMSERGEDAQLLKAWRELSEKAGEWLARVRM